MQKSKKIINLGMSGGGFYGYAEVGAINELEKYSEQLDIKNISGVSVGSMVAALYAVGYTSDELSKILFEFDFDRMIKDSMLPYIKLYEKYGMYDATKLQEEIERLIRIKTNIKFCTFNQIEKNLTVISTNLNFQAPVFFSKELTPDMVISKAVRMSIGYPIVMSPVEHNGDLYGDGGIYMNYPITMFKNLDETIGLTFSSFNENNDGTLKTRIPINDIYDYLRSLALTMTRSAYTSQITQKHLDRSIVIKINQDISSMQFNLSIEQKKYLYECGARSVQEQVERVLGVKPIIPVPIPLQIQLPTSTTQMFNNQSSIIIPLMPHTEQPRSEDMLDIVKHMIPLETITNTIDVMTHHP